MQLSRREALALAPVVVSGFGTEPARRYRVVGITTVYYHNSHADLLFSRMFQGENLDSASRIPDIELVSLYVDQRPHNDLSVEFATRYGFHLASSIEEAFAKASVDGPVDGVIIVGEHGDYPQNDKGEDLYPRKQFFDAAVAAMRKKNHFVPLYMDKHLSHSWTEAQAIYSNARKLGIALMAGSSLPGTWRRPAIEIPQGTDLKEAVAISYHTLYGYGFHALEMLQCLAERRRGGETGVRRVQCLEGAAVWEAGRRGRYDKTLLEGAIGRSPGLTMARVEASVTNPVVFLIEYLDGFRASVFTLNPTAGAWSIAWRAVDPSQSQSTLFWTQEARPLGHFTFLLREIEELILYRKSPRPIARTLLTSGMMDYLLTSKLRKGEAIETAELAIRYRAGRAWREPAPPPAPRPLDQQ